MARSDGAGGDRGKHLRARVRHAALTRAPSKLSGGRLGGRRHLNRLQVVERTVPLPELPEPMDGLRIAHVSDLHTGDLLPPSLLPSVVDAVNRLEPDLVAVTGDFVDFNLAGVLRPVLDAMRALEAPLGTHFVLGNHDHLENPRRLIRGFREADLGLLLNEAIEIPHNDHTLVVAGIDYTAKPRAAKQLIDRALLDHPPRRRHGLRLLLAHHPDAFDLVTAHRVDLTLAGHTHGGQVALGRRPGRKGSVGLGNVAFRYPRGLYQRGHAHLHVTSGVGSWFPVRVNCPAEIAVLTLRRMPDTPEASQPTAPAGF